MLLLCLDGGGQELVSRFHRVDFPRHKRYAENVNNIRGSKAEALKRGGLRLGNM